MPSSASIPKLCMALSLASVAVGMCTGTGELQAAGTLAQIGRDVEFAAKVAQGTATATGGVSELRLRSYSDKGPALPSRRHPASVPTKPRRSSISTMHLSMLQRSLRTAQRETSSASADRAETTPTPMQLSAKGSEHDDRHFPHQRRRIRRASWQLCCFRTKPIKPNPHNYSVTPHARRF